MADARMLILHAEEDTQFASLLSDRLWRLGGEPLILADLLGPGDHIGRINVALQRCDVVLLVLSPVALESPWIQQLFNASIARAQKRQMRAPIVVVAQSSVLTQLPPLWRNYPLFDATRDAQQAILAAAHDLGLPLPRSAIPHYPRLAVASASAVICIVIGVVAVITLTGNRPVNSTPYAIGTGISVVFFDTGFITLLVVCVLVGRECIRRKQWGWLCFALVGNLLTFFSLASLVYSFFGPTAVRRGKTMASSPRWAHLPQTSPADR